MPRAAREAELDKDALRVALEAPEAGVGTEPVEEECSGAAGGVCAGEWTG